MGFQFIFDNTDATETKKMIKENHTPIPDDDDIEGYVKIDRYNPELISNLSAHYSEVLKHIGENNIIFLHIYQSSGDSSRTHS